MLRFTSYRLVFFASIQHLPFSNFDSQWILKVQVHDQIILMPCLGFSLALQEQTLEILVSEHSIIARNRSPTSKHT